MGKFQNYKEIIIKGRVRACLEFIKQENLKGIVLVDVGSSNGFFISKIINLGVKKAIGVDPNKKAVLFAKDKVKKANFLVSTADSLPIKNESADLVLMLDVIEHVPKNGEIDALKEAKRILKKGGVLLLTTPYDYFFSNILDPAWYLGHRHYSLIKISKLVEKAGFRVQKLEIKGGLITSIHLIWLYISNWILAGHFGPKLIEPYYDRSFDRSGVNTIFLRGVKNN